MKKLSLVLMLLMIVSVFTGCAVNNKLTATEAKEGVVYIESVWEFETTDVFGEVTTETMGASGSGFAIGTPGEPVQYIVTNAHVVYDKEYDVFANSAVVVFNRAANDMVLAELVAYDLTKDIAVLKLPEPTTKRIALSLCKSEDFDMEDSVAALGFPSVTDLGKHFTTYSIDECVVTRGGVSRQNTDEDLTKVYLIDVDISAGNSGGPLINEDGAVIGINTYSWSILDDGTTKATANYAVCIDELLPILNTKGIDYTMASALNVPVLAIGIAGGAIVVALIVVMIVLLLKKKTPSTPHTPVADQKHSVSCTGGAMAGTVRELASGSVVKIGRPKGGLNPMFDIVYPDTTAGVSGLHCVIRMNGNAIEITDHSKYGTFVNGQRITTGIPVVLNPNDTFYVGAPEHSYRVQ